MVKICLVEHGQNMFKNMVKICLVEHGHVALYERRRRSRSLKVRLRRRSRSNLTNTKCVSLIVYIFFINYYVYGTFNKEKKIEEQNKS